MTNEQIHFSNNSIYKFYSSSLPKKKSKYPTKSDISQQFPSRDVFTNFAQK